MPNDTNIMMTKEQCEKIVSTPCPRMKDDKPAYLKWHYAAGKLAENNFRAPVVRTREERLAMLAAIKRRHRAKKKAGLDCSQQKKEHRPLLKTWQAMLQRCNNPNGYIYKYYGGRGIKVCERWETSFDDFVSDMGPRPQGFTLDRINNDGHYEPSNCRWADRLTQANNKRINVHIVIDGVSKTISQWRREGVKIVRPKSPQRVLSAEMVIKLRERNTAYQRKRRARLKGLGK